MNKKDIKLVEVKQEDIELIRQWRNSEEVSSYMYSTAKITKEEQEAWFERINDDSTSKYWIIEYDNKQLGLASLTGINKTLNSCYWAFYLGDTSVRGAGIGGKVEYNVLNYVFEELKLNKLRCEVFTFNDKVISMHEKFGFRREAFYRQHCLKDGVYHDVVGLAMLSREWQSLKEVIYTKVYGKN